MKRKIGEIELGNMAFLSDPCYGTKCRGNTTINTLEGRYNAYVTYTERNTFYSEKRISSILVVHKDFSSKYKKMPKDEREMLICAVDSGTCGIFNYDYYKK